MPSAISPSALTPLKDSTLFESLNFGKVTLQHRVVLAPLTRMRATKESDGIFVPGDLAVAYYGQRASKGGFMLTEATDICKYVCIFMVTASFDPLLMRDVPRRAVTLAFRESFLSRRLQAGNV